MKKIHALVIVIFFLSAVMFNLTAQTKLSQKEKFQSTYSSLKTLVQTKQYKFKATLVFSINEREKSESFIQLSNNTLSGELTSLTTNESVKFVIDNSEVNAYNVSFNDEDQVISIAFNITGGTTRFDFTIETKSNGSAILKTSHPNLNELQWMGNLVKL